MLYPYRTVTKIMATQVFNYLNGAKGARKALETTQTDRGRGTGKEKRIFH